MQIIRGSDGLTTPTKGSVVGIGIFDGVHLGHQRLLRKVIELASAQDLTSVTYTFEPHPAKILNPPLAPKLIEPMAVRLTRFEQLGMHITLVEPFSMKFASILAADFVRNILVAKLATKHVVVGENFTFGHRQGGNVELLRTLGQELGFTTHPVDLLHVDGIAATSSKIREFVWAGAVRGATLLLGRPYTLNGIVQRGAGRGEGLGFATANLATDAELLPAVGVYSARASGNFGSFDAVVNIGYAPTFGGTELRIEAHLLGYKGGPLYGQSLALDFIDRVRDEMRFANKDELVAQIGRDVETARQQLAIFNATR